MILVYQFDAKGTELSVAAYGLMELGGDLLGFDNHGTELNLMIISPKNSTRKSGRKHYMTIREDDKDRLTEGQYLNDALVDFWMRW